MATIVICDARVKLTGKSSLSHELRPQRVYKIGRRNTQFIWGRKDHITAGVQFQWQRLAEQLLQTPQVCGSNPVGLTFMHLLLTEFKMQIKEKDAGYVPFKESTRLFPERNFYSGNKKMCFFFSLSLHTEAVMNFLLVRRINVEQKKARKKPEKNSPHFLAN